MGLKQQLEKFDIENTTFTHNISKDLHAEIFFAKCSQCGGLIAVFCFEDTSRVGTYEGHAHSFGHKYLNGGKSKGRSLLCNHCKDMEKLVDDVKDLEHKKETLESEIRELGIRTKEILKYVGDSK